MAEQPGPAPGLTLAELARPYLSGGELIADLSAGLDIDLAPALAPLLGAGTEAAAASGHRRTTPGAWLPAPGDQDASPGGDLLTVLATGPDPRLHLPWADCAQALSRLPDGAYAVLLLSDPLADIPIGRIAGELTGQGCLIVRAAALSWPPPGQPGLPTGLAVTRTGASPALRQLNEHLLAGAVLPGLQARMAELELTAASAPAGSRAGDRGEAASSPVPAAVSGPGGTAAPPGGTAAAADSQPDRDRLARALRATQRDLVNAHAELALLENSAAVAAGRAVVSLARHPLRGGVRLPREVYRLWRARRAGGARPGAPAGAAAAPGPALMLAQDRGGAGIGDRWLSAFTSPGYPDPGDQAEGGLVVAGVLTAAGCATLGPDAVVHPLLPHNADFVLEGTGADLVLIQAAALQPGSAWAYATDPAAADRGRRLAALVSLARSLGKPVVLLRDAPWSPTASLDWLAASCDAAFDGDLGVQLARFNPIGLAGRPGDPVYAGARDPREPPVLRQVLDELGDGGRRLVSVSGYLPWRSAPEVYRGHGVFLAATAAQAREQLAAGARVVGPPGAGPPVAGSAHTPDAARVAGELKTARDAGCPGVAELMPALREIFTGHATPVRLASLARLAGLPAAQAGGRQVAVLAELSDPAEAGQLAAGLLAQQFRPAEVAVALTAQQPGRDQQARAERTVIAALRPLAAAGAVIRVTAGAGLPAAAAAARSPWAVPWLRGHDHPPGYLLDLACARECGQVDAVGFGPGPGPVFAPVSEPALARRELLAPGAPPTASWPARGLRTLTITPGERP